jgi:hypothetical protein
MLTTNGKEYVTLRDACAMSGYAEARMRGLCVEGKVACLSVDQTFLIEKESLVQHIVRIKSGEERREVPMSESVEKWRERMLGKVGVFAGVVVIFLAIVIVPTLLMSTDAMSNIDLSYAPSTYNSLSGIVPDNGSLAASMVSVNDYIARGIEGVVMSIVSFLSGVF